MAKWKSEDVVHILMSPFYAITIHPVFCEPHKPILTEDQWVQAGVRLIKDLGPEGYLRRLLDVLKGNYVTADGLDEAPNPKETP